MQHLHMIAAFVTAALLAFFLAPGMIGWALMFPHTGGADSPGEFAHLAIYPDIESFMKRRKMEANGGWRGLREYYQTYADCSGEQLMSETVMLRP